MPPPDNPGKPERLPVIDTLRFCAALGVLVFHASAFAGMPKRVMPSFHLFGRSIDTLPSVFTFGATGVSLFFVISGFCLFLSARRTPQSPPAYFVNRAARIYPAYLFALAASATTAYFISGYLDGLDIALKALFLHGFFQSYNLTMNGALWSMATEVQFYVAFPILACAMKRYGPWACVFVALAGCLAYRAGVDHLPGAQNVVGGVVQGSFLSNLLPGRIVEFVAGMAVAAFYLDQAPALRKWAVYAVVPLFALGVAARGGGPNWLAEPALGLGFSALLAVAVTRMRSAFRASPFSLMGRASYSLFLIHIPVLAVVVRAMDLSALGPYWRLTAILGVGLPICLTLALGLYAWLELPAWKRLSKSGAPSPLAAV